MPSNFGSLGERMAMITLAIFAAAAVAQPGQSRDADFIKDTTPLGHTDHGLVSSDQLLELGTQTSSALRLEGEQSMRFNNIDKAIMVLQKSVEMTPSDMDGRILYAEALEKKLNHQKDRDPALFNFAVKQWLYVAKKADFMDQKLQAMKHLQTLTGQRPHRWENEVHYLSHVLMPEDDSRKVAAGTKTAKTD